MGVLSGAKPSEVKGAWAAFVDLVYPPQCLACREPVSEAGALCGACWADTPFITGLACDGCGAPLPGTDAGPVLCDDCLTIARPWSTGRAVFAYHATGRRLVLALKHGDRHDIADPAARWMMRAGPAITADTLLAPVPLHRWRLFRRRYNQSALLTAAMARQSGATHAPMLLQRIRRTPTQDGLGRSARFENVAGSITVHPHQRSMLMGRHVVLVDDVMTTGATLAAAADACLSGGAARVDVVVLARVTHDL